MGLLDCLARPLDLLVPPTCAGCGLPGDGICSGCRRALRPPPPPGCRRCRHPWATWTDACAECPPALDALRFAGPYEGPVPAIVSALKDRRRRALAADLAAAIADCVRSPEPGSVLVPVPLAPQRLHDRGFNQSALLAQALSACWGAPVAQALARVRDDPPQRGASATDRALNVRGAFTVTPGATVPSRVWIVDDVCTTGATLGSCARVLRRAGATRVSAVCVARVM